MSPQRMGVLNVGQRIEEQAEFEKIYKNGRILRQHSCMCSVIGRNCSLMLFLCVCSLTSMG